MSRGKKLNGRQRQAMESMRRRLIKVLPASERNFAAGIASGLVRCPGPAISEEELDRVLEGKCGALASDGLRATVVETVLAPLPEGEEGYALKLDADGGGDDGSSAPAGAESDAAGSGAAAAGDGPEAAGGRSPGRHGKHGFQRIPYVRRGDAADAEARAKIVALDQRLWTNGWLLSHPGAYRVYERELTAISAALAAGTLPEGITRRQLAYRLGGNEKFFEYGSDGHKLLRAMGLEDIAQHRHLPKTDVLYFAPRRRKRMRVLVTENLDPFLDVRDAMYEDGQTRFLGERVHAVVLGAGSPILERKRLASVLEMLGADEVEVLYWGDVDRAGVDIYQRLRAMLGDRYKMRPFAAAYQLMLERAMQIYPDPADNETTGQDDVQVGELDEFLDDLAEDAGAYFRAVIEGARLVPQEILTRSDLVEDPGRAPKA